MKKHYVYTHSDKGKIVYVGKGSGGRAWDKIRKSSEHSKFIANILHKNISSIKIIKYFNDKMDAFKYENELIHKLKPKFNETWTQEHKNKISSIRRNVIVTPEHKYSRMINQPLRKSIIYMGKKYNSIRECSRINKINHSTLRYRLQNSVRS
tara:strand:+ start:53 stop:508 length:456 start_codon:yes stop_codon:yes gene_type:complete